METRLAESGGRAPGSPKGGAGAGPVAGQTHGPEVACRAVPPVPARARPSAAPARGVPERGPDAGRVGALDLSQDALVLRRCLQALRLRHLTPLHRLGEPGTVPSFSSTHLSLSLSPQAPEPPQSLATRRTTPPSVSARPLASTRPPTFHAMPSGICSSLDDVRQGSAHLFIKSINTYGFIYGFSEIRTLSLHMQQ